MNRTSTLWVLLLLAGSAGAQEPTAEAPAAQEPEAALPDAPLWSVSDRLELSFVVTSGNNDTRTLSGNNALTLGLEPYTATLTLGANRSRFKSTTTSEWYSTELRLDRKAGERFYVSGTAGWEKNVFSGLEQRSQGMLGGGWVAVKSQRHDLKLEASGGWLHEEQKSSPLIDTAVFRAAAAYTLRLFGTTELAQSFEAHHTTNNARANRQKSESSLKVAMTENVGLRIVFVVNRRDEPIPGFNNVDRVLSNGIYVTF